MGHPNEDLVRRGYDAFSSGDMQTLRELWHPDIVWHVPGRSQISGDHRVDAVLGYFGQMMELTGGALRVNVHDVVANDEHAVGLHSTHAERAGKTLDDNNTLVFHVRDGKVTEVWQYQVRPVRRRRAVRLAPSPAGRTRSDPPHQGRGCRSWPHPYHGSAAAVLTIVLAARAALHGCSYWLSGGAFKLDDHSGELTAHAERLDAQ